MDGSSVTIGRNIVIGKDDKFIIQTNLTTGPDNIIIGYQG